MKKIFLVLITVCTFNYALADDNTPVNFHPDQNVGQFYIKVKLTHGKDVVQFEQKICAVTGRRGDNAASGKFEPGCSAKKLKDTASELEFLVTCTGKPDTDMHWVRLSEDEFSFLSKSSDSEIISTYRYSGTTCDADAIRN